MLDLSPTLQKLKALLDNDSLLFDSISMTATIMLAEGNLLQLQGILANRVKKLHHVRVHEIHISLLANPKKITCMEITSTFRRWKIKKFGSNKQHVIQSLFSIVIDVILSA